MVDVRIIDSNHNMPFIFLSQDFFVFDVVEDYVFMVINHHDNTSNLYLSDKRGVKYQLSLPRVLYKNPFLDVSSPWLKYE